MVTAALISKLSAQTIDFLFSMRECEIRSWKSCAVNKFQVTHAGAWEVNQPNDKRIA
jgi:hypothetical protein